MADAHHHDPLDPEILFHHVQDAGYFELPGGPLHIPQPLMLQQPIFEANADLHLAAFDLKLTKGEQAPFTYGSVGGKSFFFNPGAPDRPVAQAAKAFPIFKRLEIDLCAKDRATLATQAGNCSIATRRAASVNAAAPCAASSRLCIDVVPAWSARPRKVT